MPQLDTADIEARLAAATPGPLMVKRLAKEDGGPFTTQEVVQRFSDYLLKTIEIGNNSDCVWFVSTGEKSVCITGNGPTSEANAELFANAPDDIRALLDEVKRLREALKEIASFQSVMTEDEIESRECSDNHGDISMAASERTSNFIAGIARARLEGRTP